MSAISTDLICHRPWCALDAKVHCGNHTNAQLLPVSRLHSWNFMLLYFICSILIFFIIPLAYISLTEDDRVIRIWFYKSLSLTYVKKKHLSYKDKKQTSEKKEYWKMPKETKVSVVIFQVLRARKKQFDKKKFERLKIVRWMSTALKNHYKLIRVWNKQICSFKTRNLFWWK